MKKLMYILMLTCKNATKLSSIQDYTKLGVIKRVQLKMHLMACKHCREFDQQSHKVEESVQKFLFDPTLLSVESLSEEKKLQFQDSVNQGLN